MCKISNLIVHYPLNGDGKETVKNKNAITYNATKVSGITGSATNISNTQFVRLPNDILNGISDFTFSFFFKLDNKSSDFNAIFSFDLSSSSSISNYFFFGIAGTKRQELNQDTFMFYINGQPKSENKLSGKVWYPVIGFNYYCTVNKKGTTWKMEIEGIDIKDNFVNSLELGDITFPVSDYIALGQEQDGAGGGFGSSQCLNGSIYDFRIYEGEISEKEKKEIKMLKYVHLNFENSLQDISGFGNHIVVNPNKHTFSTEQAQVGETCFKGDGSLGSDYRWNEYMTSCYPYLSLSFYHDTDNIPNSERLIEFSNILSGNNDVMLICFQNNKGKDIFVRVQNSEGIEIEKVFNTGIEGFKHVGLTFDFLNLIIKFYVNGSLIGFFDIAGNTFSSGLKKYCLFNTSVWFDNASHSYGKYYLDDLRFYGTILQGKDFSRIINERYFIDNTGNLFCYKKKISVGGKGFKKNGVVEFDGFHENDIDGSDGRIMRNKQGNILGINKIIEGY